MTSLKKNQRTGFTMVELAATLAVGTILLSLAAPAIQATREASRRSQCKNNLKQIGIALHNYYDTHVCFAPGWTNHTSAAGPETRFGWSATILPFIDQYTLYDQLDMTSHQITERSLLETAMPSYRCPVDPTPALNALRGDFGTMNYSGNFGSVAPPRWLPGGVNPGWLGEASTPRKIDGIFCLNSSTRVRDIVDGSSNTFLGGERSVSSGAAIWMGVRGNNFENDQVTDCSPGNEINSGLGAFSSRHEGGANFLMCDGSVRFLSDSIDSGRPGQPGTYQKLGSRMDGQTIGSF